MGPGRPFMPSLPGEPLDPEGPYGATRENINSKFKNSCGKTGKCVNNSSSFCSPSTRLEVCKYLLVKRMYLLLVQQVQRHQRVLSLQNLPRGRRRYEYQMFKYKVRWELRLFDAVIGTLLFATCYLQKYRADPAFRWILCVPCVLYLQPHQPLLCLPFHQQGPEWKQ